MAKNNKIRILIVGAGKAGELIAEDIVTKKTSPFEVVGFVDDDKSRLGDKLKGVPILGTTDDLLTVVDTNKVDEILIAIPSERGQLVRKVIETTAGHGLVYKMLPRIPEVLIQSFKEDYLKYIRKVRVEDLLGGEILKSDQEKISKFAKGKVIMITGAAGSIGSEISRQIVAHGAKHVILYDWWENGMFELRNQLLRNHSEDMFSFIIGDVKDKKKINHVMARFQPDSLFHAAAYKHVPMMEANATEAIKNNIFGTKTVAEAAIHNKVKKFVLISTDKAVNPTSIMGATKRAAEKVLHILSGSQNHTVFSAVRFGNVINSNGSAIPIFIEQIQGGGPVTVTHKDMTRFFMTIPEAVNLVLQTWIMGKNNDLFILDMGESIKIYDLARLLIALEGYTPEVDIPIIITGMRPGEKLYEEVLVGEETANKTAYDKIFRTKNYMKFDKIAFLHGLDQLLDVAKEDTADYETVKSHMKKLISTYKPKE